MLDKTPANGNVSLSSLTKNPVREMAKSALAQTLYDLELDGVPPSLLSELLFEFLMIEMEPDDLVSSEAATIWFSKLHRFRDKLQGKIDQICQLYEETPN